VRGVAVAELQSSWRVGLQTQSSLEDIASAIATRIVACFKDGDDGRSSLALGW
jgi:hypothetical protein